MNESLSALDKARRVTAAMQPLDVSVQIKPAGRVRRTSDLEEAFAWQLRVAGFPAPEREARFHLSRRWKFDFSWPWCKLAIEIEGGIWSSGMSRHTSGKGFTDDCEKYTEAILLGWRVLRFPGEWVGNGRALRYTEMALDQWGSDGKTRAKT